MTLGSTASAAGGIRIGDRQTRFLAQSVILEEAGNAGLIRLALYTVSAVVALFIAWSAVTRVDEVAATTGEVVPSGQVQVVQHLEGGIISRILVKDGQMVEAGQSLLRLEPVAAVAEQEQIRARRAGLILKSQRLRAIASGRKPNFANIDDDSYKTLIDDQRALYAGQMAAQANRRAVLDSQLRESLARLSAYGGRERTLGSNLKLVEEELALREGLFRKGVTSKTEYLAIQREANQARGDLTSLKAQREETREGVSELRNRLRKLDSELKESSLIELGEATRELAEVSQGLGKLEDRVRRLDITAPVKGTVKGLNAHTVGGIIAPGGVVLEIVPFERELIVETRITTRDIGHVAVGQPVTVKVLTYDFARYGSISGTLTDISATTFIDEDGEPYYKGIVALAKDHVGTDSRLNRVLPGMTVQADIGTGSKTVLEYLLKPVYASVNQSFRER